MKKLLVLLSFVASISLYGQKESSLNTASEKSKDISNRLYASAKGGWVWSGDLDGPSASIIAGYILDNKKHHSLEAEFFYAELEDKNKTVTGNLTFAGPPPITMFTVSKISKAKLQDRIFFANYRYSRSLAESISFSLGGGIGANVLSRSTTGTFTTSTTVPTPISTTTPSNSSASQTKIAGQIFVGLSWKLSDHISLIGGLRSIFTKGYDFQAVFAKVDTKDYQLSADIGIGVTF